MSCLFSTRVIWASHRHGSRILTPLTSSAFKTHSAFLQCRPLSRSTSLFGTKKFSEKHEWIEVESGKLVKVGITNYAQEALGELVYIQPPDEGTTVAQGEECGTVESVKAASDIYSPVSGTVTATNPAVVEEPKLVNTNPEDLGWLFKLEMSDESELDKLMTKDAYDEFLKTTAEKE